jgi:hypothetical protein
MFRKLGTIGALVVAFALNGAAVFFFYIFGTWLFNAGEVEGLRNFLYANCLAALLPCALCAYFVWKKKPMSGVLALFLMSPLAVVFAMLASAISHR